MKKYVFFSLFLFANLTIFAQIPKKWKDVSLEDFSLVNDYTIDNQSIILQESAKYYFDIWQDELRLFCEITRRILIMDSLGLKYSEIEIPYNGFEKFEEFIQFQGFTYNIENEKMKKSKVKNKNIDNIKLTKNSYLKKITFPDVKLGSIIEYRYTIATLEVIEPRKWYFQHAIPTKYSRLTFEIPFFINYQFKLNGVNKVGGYKITDSYKNINYFLDYKDPIPTGVLYQNKSFKGQVNFNFATKIYEFIQTDIEPIKYEKYVDNIDNYISSVTLNLTRIDQKNGLVSSYERFSFAVASKRMYLYVSNKEIISKTESEFSMSPSGFVLFNVNDWESLDKMLLKNKNFGLQLIRDYGINSELQKVELTDNEIAFIKMIKIYDYVRTNYKWNETYNVFSSDDLDKIIEKKTGNSADINMILILLLRKANLEANPVIIRTVDKGHLDMEYASVNQFNNTIVLVELENRKYFFDASSAENTWNILNPININHFGRVIKREKSEFVPIKSNQTAFYKLLSDIKVNSDNSLSYEISVHLYGIFIKNYEADSMLLKKEFQKTIKNYEYLKITKNILNESIFYTIKTKTKDFYKEKNIFYPFKFIDFQSDFLNPYRILPIYFGYEFEKNYIINFQINENQKFTKIPEDIIIKVDNDNYLEITYKIENKTLKVTINFILSKYFFQTLEYHNLRLIFMEFENFVNSQIEIENI